MADERREGTLIADLYVYGEIEDGDLERVLQRLVDLWPDAFVGGATKADPTTGGPMAHFRVQTTPLSGGPGHMDLT